MSTDSKHLDRVDLGNEALLVSMCGKHANDGFCPSIIRKVKDTKALTRSSTPLGMRCTGLKEHSQE